MEEIRLDDDLPIKKNKDLEVGKTTENNEQIEPEYKPHICCHIVIFSVACIISVAIICIFASALNNYIHHDFKEFQCQINDIQVNNTQIRWEIILTQYGEFIQITKKDLSVNKLEKYTNKYQINGTYPCYWDNTRRKYTWNDFKPDPFITSLISILIGFFIIFFVVIFIGWLFVNGVFRNKKLRSFKIWQNNYDEFHNEL